MKKSVMVSGMNFGTEFLTNLYKEVIKKGGTEETLFEALKTNSDLIPKFAEMIIGTIAVVPKPNAFAVTVNYDLTVEDGIKAGKYDWSNSDITSSHFPSEEAGTKEVSIELIHFGRHMETNETLSELDKMGLRPATLKELLALGEKHPGLQREFPIIALGSFWRNPDGSRDCAYLVGSDSERSLNLDWVDDRWDGISRFAAVRK